MRSADPILQGALSLDEVAEVAVLLIPDWCLEGEQFDIAFLENCRWTSRHEYVLRQPDDAKGILIVDQRTEICAISLSAMSEKPK
jgi:hypothetical protein